MSLETFREFLGTKSCFRLQNVPIWNFGRKRHYFFKDREVEEGIECLQLTSSSESEEKTKRKELNLLP
ncbi:hypothetical protein LEP1GSC203_1301 [Leptospira terpstrae serovar Hualin str. LT 11-33 = ATCC 700639]|uniref:Uncharacterized protein n=1 Tax=Leptospira terpstrae serovar Hualin str. LT 11-33 = ATCC 700639 TaxID=1257025 RepID=N1VX74_9LEPT|nr:hypothetical protein LEP1GSC203_1301 [Leptospira terpstrae serovar Hualin str. LT 11-33 = ATCC 700639]